MVVVGTGEKVKSREAQVKRKGRLLSLLRCCMDPSGSRRSIEEARASLSGHDMTPICQV